MNSFVRFLFAFGCAGLALPRDFAADAGAGSRLINISTRTQVGVGSAVPVVGFVVTGSAGTQKQVLIRAVGPTLTTFGVTGTLANPRLDLYSGTTLLASNDDWSTPASGSAALVASASSVGAFPLPANSRDAVLLATLPPGNYTAQMAGVGTANTGIALLEVYDVTGSAKLMNLSTRAQVGTGNGMLISGLAIAPGAGVRKILVRAAGPTLSSFGVTGVLADPTIAVLDSTRVQVASNNDWGTDDAAALSAAFSQAGAFAFAAGSKDAAVIADLAPDNNYTVQVSGLGNTTGIALVELYDLTPDNLASVSVRASTASTDTKGAPPGVFTFTRTGSTAAPLPVYYSVAGTAIAGVDYASLPGAVTIPAGASTAAVKVTATAGGSALAINKDTTVTLLPGANYTIDTASSADVTIFYNPGTLYITSLRAAASTTSTAYGTASVQLSADNTFAVVNVTFSNLSSPETDAYLRLGNPGEVGTELLRLAPGQVNGQVWQFQAGASFTAADLVQALKDGRIFLTIESASYPSGELRGTLIQSSGSLTFTPPPPVPALADVPLTASDAARFLTQATFGPTKPDIDALTGKKLADLNAWITAQMAVPASLHLPATQADFNSYTALSSDNPQFTYQNRQAAWWQLVLGAPDQLRQRVAFALSETLVVSDVNTTLYSNPLGMANYYDILVQGAFGNFRQVLENVTLNPIMGFYLSSLRNKKATFDTKGNLLTSPDENYAREVMQLFTIGLNQLQPDGTLKLDALGLPIPTYDQTTITETAKVFTGFAYDSKNSNPSFTSEPANWLQPMMLYPAFHEDGPKTIVGGVKVPANQGGTADLKLELDTLFNHPNTAPFISRQLIQRLVTSNPSPGYIYRVAQVFADNGSGVRGDLGAVVRAILTDPEARSTAVAATASFGKLKEPVLRATALLRAFNGGANNGRFQFFVGQGAESNLGQTEQHAPTVFNFFEPNFIQPGTLATAGLYAPEYQILTDTTAITQPNQLWTWTYANRSQGTAANPNETTIGFIFDNATLALARDPQALVNYTNLVLASGSLSQAISDRIVTAITAMPVGTGTVYGAADLERVRSAIYLTATVPQGAIQK